MTSIEAMLTNYKRDHQHPVNRATHSIGIPLILLSLPMLFVDYRWGAAMFLGGWLFQFIGHAFEGKWPSFFRDPRFLLVGATWFVQRSRNFVTGNAGETEAHQRR